MAVYLEKGSFRKSWTDFHIDKNEGYQPVMFDYHIHEYYEISLIFSGNVKVLLDGYSDSGRESRLLFLKPHSPHFITCEADTLYKRTNLLFSEDFLPASDPDCTRLLESFDSRGCVFRLTDGQLSEISHLIDCFEKEESLFRKRLILMYLLSKLRDMREPDNRAEKKITDPPAFISAALLYIRENFSGKILASELAWKLGIGRTTLMTEFKRHVGCTLAKYITDCRLKSAIELLKCGNTQSEAAEACGFGDACNMIRAFKRRFNMTPREYVSTLP